MTKEKKEKPIEELQEEVLKENLEENDEIVYSGDKAELVSNEDNVVWVGNHTMSGTPQERH